jgi:hypothetical protein
MKGVKSVTLRFSMVADNVRGGLTQRQAAYQCMHCRVAEPHLIPCEDWLVADTFCSASVAAALARKVVLRERPKRPLTIT